VDTVTDPRWVPLRVEAILTQPVVGLPRDPMHLDGPLSWGAYQDALCTGDTRTLRLPPMGEWAHDFDLPLATWTAACTRADPDPRLLAADGRQVWGWACSVADYRIVRHTVAQVRRRPPTDQMATWTVAASYHPGLGPRRAANLAHQGVWVDRIRWWVLGEPVRLREMLDRVTHVGRLARHGWGQVGAWEIHVDEAAAGRWRRRWWPDALGVPHPVRAPYHHASRMMLCRLGGVDADVSG
jgi:CRISPR type IV-associated protein Csf3